MRPSWLADAPRTYPDAARRRVRTLRPGTLHIWANDPPWFEVDPATLAALDDLHGRAGLFAWRETHRAIREWDWARLHEAAGLAIHTAPVMIVDGASTCDGVGLFDPEFGQWHIVAPPEV